ncbi:MAG: oligosaccharide flippase family protein [Roseburia sp.]|nr:oligosaccharide flippase family protein [Roseburia sp.]
MAKSLVKNSIFKSTLNICNIIIPIIVGPYVLRVLDRSYYDLYNSLNATFQFFLIFGALGIYNYGVREISKMRDDRDKCGRFFSEMFIIGAVSNLLVCGAYIGFAFFTEDEALARWLCVILSLYFFGNIFNLEWINEANENYGFIAIKSIVVKALYFVGIFVFVRKADDIIAYVLLIGASSLLNTFASFFYIKRKYKFTIKGLKFARHAAPIISTFFIVNIMIFYAQFDKLMLDTYVGESSVTAYGMAQTISSMFYSVFIALVVVTVPRVSNMLANGRAADGNILHSSAADLFFMLMIPVTVGVAMLADNVILIYGGSKYTDCIAPLRVYAALQLISSLHYMVGEGYVYIRGREKTLLVINIVGAVVNIALNFILWACGCFTATTAAATLCAAYLVVGIIDIILARKKLGYKFNPLNKHTLLYVCAAATFVPIIFAIKLIDMNIVAELIVCFLACVVVYGAILLLFKDKYLLSALAKIRSRFFGRGKTAAERLPNPSDIPFYSRGDENK